MKRELTDEELQASSIIRRSLTQNHVGKANAITAQKIIDGMSYYYHIDLSSAAIRKIINWLRNSDNCIALCSTTTGGYYVAATAQELEECCNRLHDRWVNQYETERSLRRQLDRLRNITQTALNL